MTSSPSSSLQIICLQIRLTHEHYQSYSLLKGHLLECIRQGRRNPSLPCLIILPECFGTWFYLMSFNVPKFIEKLSRFVNYRHSLFVFYSILTHLPSFSIELIRNWRRTSSWFAWFQRSWFTFVAPRTTKIYKEFCADLAQESQSTIVAGSIFTFDDDDANRRFSNLSFVFEPINGSICLKTGKEYPVDDEIAFIDRSPTNSRIYSIPSTDIDIAVLICADAWMSQRYETYRRRSTHHHRRRLLFIIVALNLGQWDIHWPGYDRHVQMPDDVRREHLEEFSLADAWRHYAVERAFRVSTYGAICCQGLLNIFDEIQAEGESMIILKRSIDDEKFLLTAQTFRDDRILICDF